MSCTRTLLIGMATLAVCGTEAAMVDAATVYGEAQRLGDGFAQVYAELDAAARPK